MADDPNDLTIQILRQIQAKLVEHDQRFEQIDRRFERMQGQLDYRFDGVERKLGEVIDSTAKALGRDSRSRLQRLEEKV